MQNRERGWDNKPKEEGVYSDVIGSWCGEAKNLPLIAAALGGPRKQKLAGIQGL